ncbi:MAG TPA: hypothetical protein VNG33_06020 [Polyangiaceae bacterium]|nr:hypothetical protein [Polyangiaceae bacterium]
MAADQPSEPPIPALVAPAQTSQKPAEASRFAHWVLLNPLTGRHADTLALGVVGFRPLPEARESLGYSLAAGEAITTVRGAFAAGAIQETELRFVPSDALSLSLRRYQWEAGPRLGSLEAMARVGFTLAHLDVGHGFSFGLFSPRVGLGLWWKLSHARVGVSAFTEYFWRWVGDDSAFVHGLTLELQPDAGPLMKRSTSSPSGRATP